MNTKDDKIGPHNELVELDMLRTENAELLDILRCAMRGYNSLMIEDYRQPKWYDRAEKKLRDAGIRL